MNKIEKEIKIINELGLHARPASLFVKLASSFSCEIIVEKGNEVVNGKSIMGVMMLAAARGSTIKISATGDDAQEAVDALEELIIVRTFDE